MYNQSLCEFVKKKGFVVKVLLKGFFIVIQRITVFFHIFFDLITTTIVYINNNIGDPNEICM